MKTIKELRIFLIFLSLVILLFVSCKNKDKTGNEDDSSNGSKNSEITLAHYSGNWYNSTGENLIFTINDDGSFKDNGNKGFSYPQITRNNEKSYTLPDGSELTFTSDTQGTFKPQGNDSPVEITKK